LKHSKDAERGFAQ